MTTIDDPFENNLFEDDYDYDESGDYPLDTEDFLNQVSGFYYLSQHIEQEKHPQLSLYLNNNPENRSLFFNFILDNFDNLSEEELYLINQSFSPTEYTSLIFNYIFEKNICITYSQFESFLLNKNKNNFIQFYQQQLMTYYVVKNPNQIKNEYLKLLFEDIYQLEHVHLIQFSEYCPDEPVLNQTFWSYFKSGSVFVNSYIEKCIDNHWTEALSLMCNLFESDCHTYFKNLQTPLTSNEIYFEKLFILQNPKYLIFSHLEKDNLNSIVELLYDKIPNKNLSHSDNNDYFNSLYQGIFYLFNYISKNDFPSLRKLFEDKKEILPSLITDFNTISYKSLKDAFQDEFIDSVFLPNTDLLFQNIQNIKSAFIFDAKNKGSSKLIEFLGEHSYLLSKSNQEYLVYRVLKKYFYTNMSNNINNFKKDLSIYSLQSLTSFSENIELFINILHDSSNTSEYSEIIIEALNSVILNKKLNTKMNNDVSIKSKKLKI